MQFNLKDIFPYVWPIMWIGVNIIYFFIKLLILKKKNKSKLHTHYIKLTSRIALEWLFRCEKVIVLTDLLALKQPQRITYLNEICDNMEILHSSQNENDEDENDNENNNENRLKKQLVNIYLCIYFNVFFLMLGEFTIYNLFAKQLLSNTCMQGFQCIRLNSNTNITCDTLLLLNDPKTVHFDCVRFFGVDSFGSFVRNFLVAYGVYLFSIGVNNYIFKYASMLVKCALKVCLCKKQNISFSIISLVIFLFVFIVTVVALFAVFYVYKSSTDLTHTDMIQLFSILVIWSLSLFAVVIKFDERKHLLPVYSVYRGNVNFEEDTNHATTAISRSQVDPECSPSTT